MDLLCFKTELGNTLDLSPVEKESYLPKMIIVATLSLNAEYKSSAEMQGFLDEADKIDCHWQLPCLNQKRSQS
jgi:hypothetical protein